MMQPIFLQCMITFCVIAKQILCIIRTDGKSVYYLVGMKYLRVIAIPITIRAEFGLRLFFRQNQALRAYSMK